MDGRWVAGAAVFLLACSAGVGPLGPGTSSDGGAGGPASDGGEGFREVGVPDDAEWSFDLGLAELDAESRELGLPDLGSPDRGTLLQIEPAHLPGAVVGVPYSVVLTASGGSGSGQRWSIVQGNLPNGLTLISAGRVAELRGAARIPLGHYPIVLQVEDDLGQRAQAAYDLAVREDQPDRVAVIGDLLVDGVEQPYLIDLTPTVPTWFAVPPTLTSGVVATGTIALSPDQRWVAWTSDHEHPPARALYLAFATPSGAGPTPQPPRSGHLADRLERRLDPLVLRRWNSGRDDPERRAALGDAGASGGTLRGGPRPGARGLRFLVAGRD